MNNAEKYLQNLDRARQQSVVLFNFLSLGSWDIYTKVNYSNYTESYSDTTKLWIYLVNWQLLIIFITQNLAEKRQYLYLF